MRRQAWVSKVPGVGPEPARFTRPQPEPHWFGNKPDGGLWTSSWDEQVCSDWVTEAGPDGMGLVELPVPTWLLTPDPAARVLVLDDLPDLHAALDTYGAPAPEAVLGSAAVFGRFLDFALLSADFDGVHLTQQGQWRTRLAFPDNLYGWDRSRAALGIADGSAWLLTAATRFTRDHGRVRCPYYARRGLRTA